MATSRNRAVAKMPETGGTVMTSTVGGLVPTPPNNAALFLNGAGLFSAPAASGVTSFNGRSGAVAPTTGDYAFSNLSGNIAVAQMNSGTSASGTTFWRGDGTWATPAGSGDMVLANVQTVTGAKTFASTKLLLGGSTSGAVTLNAPAVAGAGSVVLPLTGTLATLAGVEALTNKTINGVTIAATSGSLSIANGKTLTASNTLTLVGTDATTLTFPEITCNVGFRNIPQNSKSAAYTTVAADAGKHLYHPSADTTARIWTIDSNANVPYEIGTAITFVNDTSGGVITIAITSDTLVLAGTGSTGSRTLAANGIATAIKITSTRWIISGTGLT